ncbi:MAG: S41 family peptidase [Planctomycetota bacterium]
MLRLIPAVLSLLVPIAIASAQPVTVEITVPSDADVGAISVGLRGDTAPLAWDRSVFLADPDRDGTYTGVIDFPAGTRVVAYKAVIEREGADPLWEDGPNRMLLPGQMAADRRGFNDAQTDVLLRTLTPDELRTDLGVMLRALDALHPGLTLHNTPDEWDAITERAATRIDALGSRFDGEIPITDAYLLFSRLASAIRDGHTRVSMFNQGPYVENAFYTRADRVPFAFRLRDGRMVVTADATREDVLPAGPEVDALDGVPVREILGRMLPYTSADGGNDAKRYKELEVRGMPAPAERFDVLYTMLFEPEGELALNVRTPDGMEMLFGTPRITADTRRARLVERDPTHPRTKGDLLQRRTLPDGTAYVRIGSFATFNMDVDYHAWLRETFASINVSGTERLIVDLRDNAGGMDDAAGALLAHLIAEPVRLPLWNGVTAYDRVPDDVRPHVSSWDPSFYDISETVEPDGTGGFRTPARPPLSIAPAPDAFRGRAAVIVDATASSATFYLAQHIRRCGAAVLVGQETGGSLKGLNAGQMAFLTLPKSGVVVDVPLYGARPSVPGPDRGVVPDVVVPQDAGALIAGRDAEIEAAIAALTRER